MDIHRTCRTRLSKTYCSRLRLYRRNGRREQGIKSRNCFVFIAAIESRRPHFCLSHEQFPRAKGSGAAFGLPLTAPMVPGAASFFVHKYLIFKDFVSQKTRATNAHTSGPFFRSFRDTDPHT